MMTPSRHTPSRIGRARRRALASIVLSGVAAATSHAQVYPTKPIRFVVPFPPGGVGDIVARPTAQKLSAELGQPVVVENRPGATGTIGAAFVAKSPPDGYTLLLGTSNELSMSPALYRKLPFDPVRDFAPVSTIIVFPNLLVVHPALPVKSATGLIALARSRPGEINFGSAGPGSTNHLTSEVFQSIAGVRIGHVPYKGGGPALTDVMGGHVEGMFATMPSAVQHVKGGKLKALLVTSDKRSAALPDVQSSKDAGMPTFIVSTFNGMVAPAGAPADVLRRLHAALVKVSNTPDMVERMAAVAAEVQTVAPERFAAILRDDLARWTKVVKDAGIQPE
jgi:tripartite-type tricarboxylate transporter receptor subunit TctC